MNGQVNVRLRGGPKDGWVYPMPLHWEVIDGVLVWLPPNTIDTAIGVYVPAWPELLTPARAADAIAHGAEPTYEWRLSEEARETPETSHGA